MTTGEPSAVPQEELTTLVWPCRLELVGGGVGCHLVDVSSIARAVCALGLPDAFAMSWYDLVAVLMAPLTFPADSAVPGPHLAAAAATAGVSSSELLRSLLAADEYLNPPT